MQLASEGVMKIGAVRTLGFFLLLISPILLHAQGLTAVPSTSSPFAADQSGPPPGVSPASRFAPYVGDTRPEGAGKGTHSAAPSGFDWSQFFRSAAQTGTRFAAPKMSLNGGQGPMSGGNSLFPAGPAGMRSMGGGSSSMFDRKNGLTPAMGMPPKIALGDSFNLTPRGLNFAEKSAGLNLHLGLSDGGRGGSFTGSGSNTTGNGAFGVSGVGGPNGRNAGDFGDGGSGKGGGAKLSLQLKF